MATILSGSYSSLLFTACMMGLGLGTTIAAARLKALEDRASSNVNGTMTLTAATAAITSGLAFGPLIAGTISQMLGVKTALFVHVIICLLSVVYGSHKCPEMLLCKTNSWPSVGQLCQEFKQAVNPDVSLMILATAAHSILFFGHVLQWLPVECSQYWPGVLAPAKFGILYLFLILFPALFAYHAGKAGDTVGHPTMVFLAGLLITIAVFFAGAVASPGSIVGVHFLSATGFGIVMLSTGAQLVKVAPEEMLAKAMALQSFAWDIGAMYGPLLVEYLTSTLGNKGAFQIMSTIGVAFSISFVFLDSVIAGRSKIKTLENKDQRSSLPPFLNKWKGTFTTTVFGLFLVGLVFTGIPSLNLNHDFEHGPMNIQPPFTPDDDGETPLFTSFEKDRTESEWEAYKAARARCKWVDTLVSSQDAGICYRSWPTKEAYMADPDRHQVRCSPELKGKWAKRAKGIYSQDCVEHKPALLRADAAPTDGDSDEWRIQRIGPLKSSGGDDWHDLLFSDPTSLRKYLRWHPSLSITGSFIGIVDGVTGEPLAYPPVRLHHIHVYTDHFTQESFERHSDSGCLSREGGAKCLMEMFPAGYGMRVERPYEVACSFNDVRASKQANVAKSNQTELMYFLEIGFQTTLRRVTPITRGAFMLAGDPYSPAMTYDIPNTPSVLWSTMKNPRDQYLWFYGIHSHMPMVDELWILTAEAETIGLNKGQYVLPSEFPWDVLAPLNFTSDSMKEELAAIWDKHLRTMAGKPTIRQSHRMCRIAGSTQLYSLPGLGARGYDRQPERDCLATLSGDWKEGDVLTMIAFNRGLPPKTKPTTRRQHSFLRVLSHQEAFVCWAR
ncbi:hypothetical protein CYMTET_5112 [Cymbomonas tetramitiformis]|uniref:Major facilitator superfamily (MFS) profile domain-containing protein n=1 Tax=Cymbomonas tetramitiformis TaxID=36881 RepID=A0AAE0LJS8_9CHLO|nr:hypothetical protein CYMTET_5112 [Cymbomonas tetramitiformis]